MRLGLVGLFLLGALSEAAAGVRTVGVTDPRPFGHFVGDVILRHAEITVDPGDELLAASLPHPGPVAYWLDLVGISTAASEKGGAKHYRINLTYQSFYVPLESKRVTIPPLTVRFKTTAGDSSATIPAFGFTMSPLRELFAEKGEGESAFALRPDAEPSPIKTGSVRTTMLVSAVSAALSFVLIAHHNAWGPFRRRPQRPFTKAARQIRHAVNENGSGAGYRKGLLALHRAFDEFAGQRLLGEDLDRFLDAHPSLAADSGQIHRFFDSSRAVFFAEDVTNGIATLPPSELSALATRLADIERGAA